MKNKVNKLTLALAITSLALICQSNGAQASGHFIAELQDQYPAYDLNDTYVFQSSNEGFTTIISSTNPSTPGSTMSPTDVVFGQGGLYNLHLAQDGEFKIGMTLVFSFKGENFEVRKIDAPNAVIGEKGKLLGNGKLGEVMTFPNGIRVWVGRGNDPFFGNGVGLGKFNAAKQKGVFSPELFKEDGDLFVGATASFIVADVPNQILGDEVKVFTTTSVKHNGEWSQVDRHANVLFPYVFLSDTPSVYKDHEQHRPDLDVKVIRQTIVHNVFWAVSVSKAKVADRMEYANEITDLVIPDVLKYKPGTKARYIVDELNGRHLHDDAMNTVLQLMTGVVVDDNANDAKRYTAHFPYIVPAKLKPNSS